jgi:hypothetical protein
MSSNGKSSIDFSCPLTLADDLCTCRATFEMAKRITPGLVEDLNTGEQRAMVSNSGESRGIL